LIFVKYLKQEYPGVKVLSLYTTDPGIILMTKKLVKLPEDLREMRVRSPGPQQTAMLKELGASPLSLPGPEVYDALQRGITEGVLTPTSALKDFRFHEVAKYYTGGVSLFTIPCALVMNLKAWNSLPPDIQQIFDDLAGARLSERIGRSVDQTALLSLEEAKKAGIQIYGLTSEEKKVWVNRVKPVNDKWIADMEAKGLPGKKVYEDAVKLSQKYSK
jgi:TRAP-type C4-dicarboxylate transport system substrate-binding protein